MFKKLSILITICLLTGNIYAQDADVSSLIKQGIQLNNDKNYAGAIEKYKQALAAEPDNAQANYQLAFSLNASGKGADGLPYLNTAIKVNGNFTGPAYELMGSIYDAAHQSQQAIDAYKAGIKLKPDYQPLYFNLGIAYFRANQYADAEQAATEAIKLDPKHANSRRLYGLVTFHQNKRVPALMGLCSFLLLDPEGPRADEAYTNLQSILKGGILKTDGGKIDAETILLNKTLAAAIASANQTKGAAYPLEVQLKSIFDAVGKLSEKQTDKSFFWNYYASFFYQLSQSGNMPAAARLIGLSGNKTVNAQWLQDNADKRKALEDWLNAPTPKDNF